MSPAFAHMPSGQPPCPTNFLRGNLTSFEIIVEVLVSWAQRFCFAKQNSPVDEVHTASPQEHDRPKDLWVPFLLSQMFDSAAVNVLKLLKASIRSRRKLNTTTNISTALLAALLWKAVCRSSNNKQQATQSTSCCPLSIVDSLKYQSKSCLESWSSCVTSYFLR